MNTLTALHPDTSVGRDRWSQSRVAAPALDGRSRGVHMPNHRPVSVVEHARESDASSQGVWSKLRQVRSVILELREIRTLRQLVDATPPALCRIGFDRAMVSRVEESTWVVERYYSQEDAAWVAQINDLTRRNPQPLTPSLVESDMYRRRIPVLVRGAQQDRRRVNRTFARACRTESYVAAPIMPDGRVIGFLHADCFHQGREVDQFDLEVLSHFAEQYGHVLERTLLLERLDGLQHSIEKLTEALSGAVTDCSRSAIDMSQDGRSSVSGITLPLRSVTETLGTPPASPDSALTPRELEVLEMMATGDTNARIASRLVVSEGTVKTHVKNILRKLGAANRAEAVCRWLQRS
jgi:DNA-binding CsgD family transcriptional regulator